MTGGDEDRRVRLAAFQWLGHQVRLQGETLPRPLLEDGFVYRGTRVPLLGPQGIFKPKVLPEIPLSITTTPKSPYKDHFGGGLLRYAYRGTDRTHPDNAGLRMAMTRQAPLVYFHGILPGKYLAAWPVYVVGDDPGGLTFTVAVDDERQLGVAMETGDRVVADAGAEARREYVTATFRARLHQRSFRERVLRAYRDQCALCRLRHEELLDAAHIIPDAEPGGDPIVPNGLALCKLHHAAFDGHFLTVRPDYVVEVRRDILEERDGPMLVHGLKGMHLHLIHLPRSRDLYPDPERLESRYRRFREAS